MAADASGARLRAEAARIVESVVGDGRSLDAALAEAEKSLAPADRAFVRMLCYGALRFHFRLRAELRELLARPLRTRDRVVESLLVVGFFQLGDTRIPDHAAVSATVEATRMLRRPRYAGLVNAVLRNFQRRRAVRTEAAGDEARFNHPGWLIDRLRADWPERWEAVLAANDERAPMWLRVNRRRMSATDYLQRYGVDGEVLPGVAQAVRLRQPVPVEELAGFEAGEVSVQDAAAQLAAPWLLENGGSRVLDACAAPGGKTGHLLELLAPDATLTAVDLEPERLGRVRENLDRLGLDATLVAADASKPETWWDGKPFDRILLDAPCSATGVIRRHPDIKVLRRDTDVAALARLQRSLLEVLWTTLAPEGRLLYVTCSVLADENERVVAPFLASRDDAREDRLLHAYNIRALMCERDTGFQVLPGTNGLDGFYFACLEKVTPDP